MRWIAVGTVMLAAAFCEHSWGADDDDLVVFAPKLFTDLPAHGSVVISGTLTGEGIAYKNNTVSISCYKTRRECYIAYIQQIAHNQMGQMQKVEFFRITKWSDDEVVAMQNVTQLDCVRATIVIDRKSKTALYVREPVNQTRSPCVRWPAPKLYKWTIEDSPGWEKAFGEKSSGPE